MSGWPFDAPRNAAAVTVTQVMDGFHPILLVCHDADDGGWQFLTGENVSMADALLVSLGSVVERDPTVADLADLPEGWKATRADPGADWVREPQ